MEISLAWTHAAMNGYNYYALVRMYTVVSYVCSCLSDCPSVSYQYICSPGKNSSAGIWFYVHTDYLSLSPVYLLLGWDSSADVCFYVNNLGFNLPEFWDKASVMELWKDLITSKALASDQDLSEGKPPQIGQLYNLSIRLKQQW